MGYSMKKGVMMRAGYDKGSCSPFTQTPPEDARSGEAQAKANQAAASSEKVYGEATTTNEKTVQDGVKGTLFKTTRPYTQSGTGSAEGTMSYAEFEAKGGDVEAAKKYWAEQALSGQDVSTSFRADVKAISLKPKGLVPLSVELPRPKIEIPKPKYKTPTMEGMSIGAKNKNYKVGLGLGGSVGSKQKGRKMGCKGGGCATNRGKS
jgi:hypothetical protein